MQAANPADISELISDDETGLLIVRQPNFQTEHFTKAMADLDVYLSMQAQDATRLHLKQPGPMSDLIWQNNIFTRYIYTDWHAN